MNWNLIQNSFWLSLTVTLLALALGGMAALHAAGMSRRGRQMFLGVAVVCLALPPFLVANCWMDLFGHAGKWRGWLPFNIYSFPAAVGLLALMLWPITSILVLGDWSKLERSHLESEPALRGWPLLRWLLIPLAAPALRLAALLTFILTFNHFSIPALLQVKVLPAELWIQFSTTFDYQRAALMSWPLLVLLCLLFSLRRAQAIAWPRLEGSAPSELWRRQLGPSWRVASGITTGLLTLLSLGIPLGQLLFQARTWSTLGPAFAAGSLAVWNSFWFAMLSATLCVGAGLALWRQRWPVAFWVPFLLPGLLTGISLIFLLNRPFLSALYQSAGIVLIGLALRYLVLAWKSSGQALRGMDPGLIDWARVSGARGFQLWRWACAPQVAASTAGIWYVIYLLCLWDVETLVLIIPPAGETLSLRIFNLLHYGHNEQVNALCVLLLLLALAPLLVWSGAQGCAARGFGRPSAATSLSMNRDDPSVGRRCRAALIYVLRGQPSRSYGSAGSTALPRIRTTFMVPMRVQFWRSMLSMNRRPIGRAALPRRPDIWAARPAFAMLRLGRQHSPTKIGGVRGARVEMIFAKTLPLLVGLCAGCAPDPSRGVKLESALFERVVVIGGRGTALGSFNKPRSLAVDSQDNLYVVDMTARVQKFSSNGVFVSSWQMMETDKGKPKGMTRDPDGNIVVIEPHYARVNHYSTEGQLVKQWGEFGTETGQLMFPRSAVINSRGEIFVSEFGKFERIQRFGPDGPTFLGTFGQRGAGPAEFNRAEGLGLDAEDRLYVADSCNHRIQIFSPEGRFLRSYGRAGNKPGELSYPYDIRVDAAGRQFVCEFGNSRVQVFDREGNSLEILGEPGGAPGQFSNPWSLALDSAGNLYVADSQNHRVQKFIRRHPEPAHRGQSLARGRLAASARPGIHHAPRPWHAVRTGTVRGQALWNSSRWPAPACGRARDERSHVKVQRRENFGAAAL